MNKANLLKQVLIEGPANNALNNKQMVKIISALGLSKNNNYFNNELRQRKRAHFKPIVSNIVKALILMTSMSMFNHGKDRYRERYQNESVQSSIIMVQLHYDLSKFVVEEVKKLGFYNKLPKTRSRSSNNWLYGSYIGLLNLHSQNMKKESKYLKEMCIELTGNEEVSRAILQDIDTLIGREMTNTPQTKVKNDEYHTTNTTPMNKLLRVIIKEEEYVSKPYEVHIYSHYIWTAIELVQDKVNKQNIDISSLEAWIVSDPYYPLPWNNWLRGGTQNNAKLQMIDSGFLSSFIQPILNKLVVPTFPLKNSYINAVTKKNLNSLKNAAEFIETPVRPVRNTSVSNRINTNTAVRQAITMNRKTLEQNLANMGLYNNVNNVKWKKQNLRMFQ